MMSYRTYAVLVITVATFAISYVAIFDGVQAAPYCEVIEIGDVMRMSANQKIGEPLTKNFQFENTKGKTIVITRIRPQSAGVEVKCDSTFPKEMQDKETFDFSLSVTPGPSDYERIAGAFVYWKELGSETEKPIRFEFKYRCTQEWEISPTHIELGRLAVGKDIAPIDIQFKRLKGSKISLTELEVESKSEVEVKAEDSAEPTEAPPEGDTAREVSGTINIHLPTPKQSGGYVHSVSVKEPQSNRVEVIYLSGTVESK